MFNSTDISEIYIELLQFYAKQSHFLDEGRYESWAKTFDENGSFRFGDIFIEGRIALQEASKIGHEGNSSANVAII